MKPATTWLTSTSMNFSLGSTQLTSPVTSELDYILSEIEKALKAGLSYAAVSVALSIPDVCSALETDVGHSRFKDVGKRYRAWCQKYLEPRFERLKAMDCWALRGGVVHNAMLSKHPQQQYDRIILMPANEHEIIVDEALITTKGHKALQIYIPRFCERMNDAAKEWYADKKRDATVQKNLPDLLRWRPKGLSPYIVGIPLIA